jgi:cysteine-rich repeat protein
MHRTNRSLALLLPLGLTVAVGATLVHCSGPSPVCGNGLVEAGEQCDKGPDNGSPKSGCSSTCQQQAISIASLQIFYTRLMNEAPGFESATCADLGVNLAHVVLTGPSPVDEMWPCSKNSTLYPNVMPGTYQATITLLDAAGAPLTKPVVSTQMEVMAPQMVTLTVNFHQMDFVKQDYTGTLDFTPKWASMGQSCAQASPSVMQEGVMLKTPAGAMVMGMTTTGHKLDGTPGACFTGDTMTGYERVTALPWGHYDLTLLGKISGGATGYCKTFDVFVGPGVDNPKYTLVADPANADAGGHCP